MECPTPCSRSMLEWLCSTRVVQPNGAVLSWDNPEKPGYAYPEAAGYLLALLSSPADCTLPLRDRISRKLCADLQDRAAVGRENLIYLFDTAIALNGLIAHARAGGNVEPRLLTRMYDAIAALITEKRAVVSREECGATAAAPRWSLTFGCHQLKVGIALIAYQQLTGNDASLALAEDLLRVISPLYQAGRFVAFTGTGAAQLHAHCYALEGLVELARHGIGCHHETQTMVLGGSAWLERVQRPDGGFDEWHDGRRGWGRRRSDVAAQAVRIWCSVDPQRYNQPISRALGFLAGLAVRAAGLRFDVDSPDINTCATIFAVQAMRRLESAVDGERLI
jgi:hypothetical protein